MRSAEEIIIELINTNKINGEDAIVLIKAICTNNANGSITINPKQFFNKQYCMIRNNYKLNWINYNICNSF